jgi:hypothetical protein
MPQGNKRWLLHLYRAVCRVLVVVSVSKMQCWPCKWPRRACATRRCPTLFPSEASPRCARQAELRSGSGERHNSSVQPQAKRLATGARRGLGGTESSVDSPSAAKGSDQRGTTMLPSTALKSTHKSVLPGGQASMAQAIIQEAKSRVSAGSRAHHTVLQTLEPKEFSALIESLKIASDKLQSELGKANKRVDDCEV